MAEGAEELLLDEGTNKSNKEREREREWAELCF